jgi:hypothetical protein
MRKKRMKLLNIKYIIAYHIKLIREQGILAKQNYMSKYFIKYLLICSS